MIKRKYLILLSMIGMLVSLDQLTKLLVVSNFRLGESSAVLPNFFSLTLVHNEGAAFGFLATLPPNLRDPFFMVVPVLTLLVIMAIFTKLREEQAMSIYSLSLIVSGALGNLIDRLHLGFVVDFLDFHWQYRAHFPAFNVADIAISLGVLILLIGIITEKESKGSPDVSGIV